MKTEIREGKVFPNNDIIKGKDVEFNPINIAHLHTHKDLFSSKNRTTYIADNNTLYFSNSV